MENNEKVMSGEESLRIITEMINKTKVNIMQSSFHLLFWGWLIFVCSLSEVLLFRFTDFANPWYVWFFVIPGSLVSAIYGYVKGKQEHVFTYATRVYVWTWLAFFFAMIVLFIVHSREMESISSYILTLAGIPTFISGVILNFRPLIYGGVSFWLFALVGFYGGETFASLSIPLAMVTGYLIPGYLLKYKVSHGTV